MTFVLCDECTHVASKGRGLEAQLEYEGAKMALLPNNELDRGASYGIERF